MNPLHPLTRRLRAGAALVLVSCALSASVAQAQAPAPSATVAAAAPAPLWSGDGNLSYIITAGNAKTSTFGAGANLFYKPTHYVYSLKSAFIRTSANDVQTANQFNTDLRAERSVSERFSVFAQYGFLRNTFTGFLSRNSGDLGVGFVAIQSQEHTLKTELGAGAITENRVGGGDQSFATAVGGLIYTWKFSKTAEVSNDTRGLLNLKTSEDWRLNNTLALSAAMSSIFSIKFSYVVQYLNLPVAGRKNTDTITTTALVAKF